MTTLRNHTKERLAAGELSIGLALRQTRTVETGRILATCGYDWAFIDMEHNAMTIDTAVQVAIGCQDAGVTPLVRVPGYAHHHASRVLDSGAMGIVFPHVDTAEEAQKLVGFCKYPPAGHRSVGGPMSQLNYANVSLDEGTRTVNQETLVVMMVESPTAVENVEAIAAVPGVDVVLTGTNDLCLEMGIPGQLGHPDVKAAYRKITAACKAHGKWAGMGGVYDEELSTEYIGMGMRFILAGSDLSLFMQAASQRTRFLRGLKS